MVKREEGEKLAKVSFMKKKKKEHTSCNLMNVNKHKGRDALKSAHTVTLTLALPPPPQCDCCALISACNYVFMAAHTVVIVLNK